MQIDLTEQEVIILDQALQAWEGSAHLTEMMGAMILTALPGGRNEADIERMMKERAAKADAESSRRRLLAAMVRAKIAMVLRPINVGGGGSRHLTVRI